MRRQRRVLAAVPGGEPVAPLGRLIGRFRLPFRRIGLGFASRPGDAPTRWHRRQEGVSSLLLRQAAGDQPLGLIDEFLAGPAISDPHSSIIRAGDHARAVVVERSIGDGAIVGEAGELYAARRLLQSERQDY